MVAMIVLTENEMLNAGLSLMCGHIGVEPSAKQTELRKKWFTSMYGISALVCSQVFFDIQHVDIGDARIRTVRVLYFLMTLNWLYRYQTEDTIARTFRIQSLTTVSKHLWAYAKAIQGLKVKKVRSKFFLVERNILVY